MRPRQGTPLYAAFRNPTVIGALAVLITILAVFLAYNANNGLPFVKTYRLTAQVPDANGLVKGNEVRIGGVRVGVIEDISPVQNEDGSTNAAPRPEARHGRRSAAGRLDGDHPLALGARPPVPADRPRHLRGGLRGGGRAAAGHGQAGAGQFDEVLWTFDEPTRVAIKQNLFEFGNALAGRGPDLNMAIGAFKPLLPRLERVTRLLANPNSGIGPFFAALEQSAAEVAPVAETQAQMFVELNTTLARLRRHRPPLPAGDDLAHAGDAAGHHRHAAHDAAVPGQLARPVPRPRAGHARRWPSPPTRSRSALLVGTPVLRKSPILNAELPPTAASLRAFNDNPDVRTGLRRLTDLSNALDKPLRFIAPAQASATTRRCSSATSPAPAARATSSATGSAATRSTTRPAPTTRAARRARRRTAAAATGPAATSCTRTPTRTPRRRARRSSARPATRPTRSVRRRSATCPATRASTPRARSARRTRTCRAPSEEDEADGPLQPQATPPEARRDGLQRGHLPPPAGRHELRQDRRRGA